MEPELSQSDKAARDKINGKSGLYLSEAKGVIELDRFKVTQDQKQVEVNKMARKKLRNFVESWVLTFQLMTWTRKDTVGLAVSILSGICGSLLCLWSLGII